MGGGESRIVASQPFNSSSDAQASFRSATLRSLGITRAEEIETRAPGADPDGSDGGPRAARGSKVVNSKLSTAPLTTLGSFGA